MIPVINVHEAKTHLSQILEDVQAGQEFILAKAGKAYARLVPIESNASTRMPGRLSGHVDDAFFESLPDDELNAWDKF